jgi:type IV pilus assembly protein PilQ
MKAKLAVALLTAAVAAVVLGQPTSAQDRGPLVISDIRQESDGRSTRLAVECSGPLAYTYYSPDPLTLVVDVPEVDASKVPARINVGTREVESLRVTSLARADGRSLARIEVRLASLVPYQIFSKDKTLNMVFERPGELAQQASAPAAAPEPPRAAAVADAEPVAAAPRPEARASEPERAPAPAVNAGPAGRILGVSQAHEGAQLAITVKADGALDYQDFFLGNPDRLVVDFKGVVSRSPIRSLDVNQGPVRKVRLGQFSANDPKVARLVMDLNERSPYRIVEGNDGVKIVFGEGQAPSPAPLAALRAPEPEPAQAPPPPLTRPDDPSLALPALPEPLPTEPQAPPPPTEDFEARTIGEGEKKFTGHPISLDFKDGDLQDIFRLFHDISGLNIVVNPGVTGKVTLSLTEVPWDQALDLILKTNNLGYSQEGNVIRIAKLTDLQREESERRKLAEEKALAGDLQVWQKSLSYAKAGDLEPTVKKVALSARGTITLDTRTNTMIITDLPLYIGKARELITNLDRATPQVEIEARIIVTSRNFTRELGVQWGFLNEQSTRFGNTTTRSFPNSILIDGSSQIAGGLTPPGGRGYAVNLPAPAFNTALGVSMGNILGNFSLDAAITALEQQGRGRILSTPKVTTQNNQSAEIKQGVQIPVQILANNTVTVQFKDAVLTLKVTPQITDAGTVILALEVNNDSPDFSRVVGPAQAAIPPINTQSVKTNVLVSDGATAVIGGVYQNTEQTSRRNTPLLADIPILGYLFRSRSIRNENQELLIFITPRIVKS